MWLSNSFFPMVAVTSSSKTVFMYLFIHRIYPKQIKTCDQNVVKCEQRWFEFQVRLMDVFQEVVMTLGQSLRSFQRRTVLSGKQINFVTRNLWRPLVCYMWLLVPSSSGTGTPSSLIKFEVMTSSCCVTFLFVTSVTWWWRTRRSSLVWSKNQLLLLTVVTLFWIFEGSDPGTRFRLIFN